MSKPTVLEPTEIHVGQRGIRIVQNLESWLAWDEKKHWAHIPKGFEILATEG